MAEVREAVDFLRYYASEAEARIDGVEREHIRIEREYGASGEEPRTEPGVWSLGPVTCISLWNFPMAIFAARSRPRWRPATPALAKPAEETPLDCR